MSFDRPAATKWFPAGVPSIAMERHGLQAAYAPLVSEAGPAE